MDNIVTQAEIHRLSESSDSEGIADILPGQQSSSSKPRPKAKSSHNKTPQLEESDVIKMLLKQNQTMLKLIEKR